MVILCQTRPVSRPTEDVYHGDRPAPMTRAKLDGILPGMNWANEDYERR